MNIGIDDINLYITPLRLNTKELQTKRGLSDKAIMESGFESRSIVPCYEDVVTQAVNAALPIVKGHESEYNLLIVGTESSFDFGKPISSYVHKYLELPTACSNFEIKHACYSGTAALKMACAWVSQQKTDKKALVVMSDIGRSHFKHPSEVTTGSGAVALSISKDPKILSINLQSGCAAHEVYDVARPSQLLEYSDSVLSIASFLDLAEMAWSNFDQQHKIKDIQSHFSYMLFHMPLLSLIQKAHAAIMESASTLSPTMIENDFKTRVTPSLSLNAHTGNLFSGSIYASLLGLLNKLDSVPELPISLFSYGSGACAEFYEAHINKDAPSKIKSKNLDKLVNNRFDLDLEAYEKLVTELETISQSADYSPDYNQIPGVYNDFYEKKGLLVLDKIVHNHRLYKFS